MTTHQVDVKHIGKLPSVKSWRSTELTKRLVFKLFSGLRHGELVVHDNGETHRFGGGDLSIAPSASVLLSDSHGRNHGCSGGLYRRRLEH